MHKWFTTTITGCDKAGNEYSWREVFNIHEGMTKIFKGMLPCAWRGNDQVTEDAIAELYFYKV